MSKEYLRFFQKNYRDSTLQTNGLTPKQQKTLRGRASTYLSRTKQQMKEDMEALATLASLLPEKHLAEVLTEENIDKLTSALLAQSWKKSRKTDPNRPAMMEREYRIAAMLMEKGLAKCSEQFAGAENNRELSDFITREAYRLVLILTYPERRRYTAALDYNYNPERYRPDDRSAR